ncbi:filamin-binding LIM protein 1 isoform X2 [Hoplias malabaricus]
MASAAPQKRMVSSVFITLTSPYRAKVTPTPQVQSPPPPQIQSTAVPLSPPGTQRKPSSRSLQDVLQDASRIGSSTPEKVLQTRYKTGTQSPALDSLHKNTLPLSTAEHTQRLKQDKTPQEYFPPPPPPPSLVSEVCDDLTAPPPLTPPTGPPADLRHGPEITFGGSSVEALPPAGVLASPEEEIQPDVCGFCRKPVSLREAAIEALNRTYHSSCFQCRQCHAALAGKMYYNKAGIPLCEDCYQASLEPCWACGDVIKDHVIRALERAYHPPCFVCTTCRQPIGEQRFAQGEVGEVYCLQDYYRKYAPQCSICEELIIPREDGTDSFTVECLGRSFHEDCYRCEVCGVLLSPEPNEHGCHPLDGQILCKPCHLSQIQTSQH